MYVVAITALATSVEAEAAALAAELGTTAYEERLNLVAGLPAVVLTTAAREQAQQVLGGIRRRGNSAVACDAAAVVPSEAMVPMRRFALEADAITTPDAPGERLPYADVLALFRAAHRTRTEARAEVKTKQLSVGRALATGGLLVSKSVQREETTVTQDVQQTLYLFRASGERPWLLRERGTQYTALGSALAASSAQNFLTTISLLRARAPQAAYDERLMAPRGASGRAARTVVVRSNNTSMSSSIGGVDLLAHLLALSLRSG